MRKTLISFTLVTLTACGATSGSIDMPNWYMKGSGLSSCGTGVAAMPHKRALSVTVEQSIAEAKKSLKASFEVLIASKLKRKKSSEVSTNNDSVETSSEEAGKSTINEVVNGGLKYTVVKKQEVRDLQVFSMVCIDADRFAESIVETYKTDNVLKNQQLQDSRKILLEESRKIAAFTAKYGD